MFQISLAAARVNAGFRQHEAAEKIGVTAKTLRGYEKGTTAIPGHLLRKLAKLYSISENNIRLPIVDDGEFDEEEKNLNCSTV
ncbi:helix-turn-helix transcriptional regulator [Virgibacillus halodenitrificans]|uniref:helix-turn-helix domain-containing protein n=1 Tax=Virgibacillus halodenitrificans TaxID=1482 RepID=UPI001FB292A8|nr:helix-turn-helix transcriptional regulator [Virgibacillus halodenitrificans]MCJ0932581.1 helix-turn-helix transcriptional regulator [Virgibacillus halodenitrificans]